ncbi:MAG: hypothetical protein U0414_25270 [Polyangiaceae bacterium]
MLIDPLVAWMLEVLRLAGEGAYLAEVASLEPQMILLHRVPRI